MNKTEKQLKISEIRKFAAEITSSKETSRQFLQRAGILDKKGKVATPYRENESKVSYRYSSKP